jgi:SanA protein
MTLKRFFYAATLLLVIIFIIAFVCNKTITDYAKGKLYSDTQSIPYRRVGLLLGTSKFTGETQRPNPFYDRRIAAAVELIRAQKIKYIILSGDNSRKEYDEPTQMRTDLMNAGVDSTIIFLDYAGFRTFDSMVRLKEVFGQDSATVISQPFHNERAIYIAKRLHISAIGYNAADVSAASGLKTMIREKFARTKVFVDFLVGKEAKFLGERVVMPE